MRIHSPVCYPNVALPELDHVWWWWEGKVDHLVNFHGLQKYSDMYFKSYKKLTSIYIVSLICHHFPSHRQRNRRQPILIGGKNLVPTMNFLAEVHLPQDYEADYAGLTILTFSCQFLADGRWFLRRQFVWIDNGFVRWQIILRRSL